MNWGKRRGYGKRQYRRLKREHPELFTSQKYIDTYGKPSTIEDLKNHKLIGYNDERLWQYAQFYWVNKESGEKLWASQTHSINVSSAELAISAAEQGLGIAELAREFKEARSPNLIELFPDIENPVGELHYIYRKEYSKLKRITAFGEFLQQKLKKTFK